jgi:hypothetical protein
MSIATSANKVSQAPSGAACLEGAHRTIGASFIGNPVLSLACRSSRSLADFESTHNYRLLAELFQSEINSPENSGEPVFQLQTSLGDRRSCRPDVLTGRVF